MIVPNRLRLIGMRVYYFDGTLSQLRVLTLARAGDEDILCERYNIDGE